MLETLRVELLVSAQELSTRLFLLVTGNMTPHSLRWMQELVGVVLLSVNAMARLLESIEAPGCLWATRLLLDSSARWVLLAEQDAFLGSATEMSVMSLLVSVRFLYATCALRFLSMLSELLLPGPVEYPVALRVRVVAGAVDMRVYDVSSVYVSVSTFW